MSCGPSVTNIFVYIKLNNFNLLSLSSMAKCLKKTYTIFEKNILYLKHQLLLKCVRSELAWHILLLLDVNYIIIISIINYLYWYFRSVSMQKRLCTCHICTVRCWKCWYFKSSSTVEIDQCLASPSGPAICNIVWKLKKKCVIVTIHHSNPVIKDKKKHSISKVASFVKCVNSE